jgi:hypothetical protein
LLGMFLTPLLTAIPLSWLVDWMKRRKTRKVSAD